MVYIGVGLMSVLLMFSVSIIEYIFSTLSSMCTSADIVHPARNPKP